MLIAAHKDALEARARENARDRDRDRDRGGVAPARARSSLEALTSRARRASRGSRRPPARNRSQVCDPLKEEKAAEERQHQEGAGAAAGRAAPRALRCLPVQGGGFARRPRIVARDRDARALSSRARLSALSPLAREQVRYARKIAEEAGASEEVLALLPKVSTTTTITAAAAAAAATVTLLLLLLLLLLLIILRGPPRCWPKPVKKKKDLVWEMVPMPAP